MPMVKCYIVLFTVCNLSSIFQARKPAVSATEVLRGQLSPFGEQLNCHTVDGRRCHGVPPISTHFDFIPLPTFRVARLSIKYS
jgi:hypothetical protein